MTLIRYEITTHERSFGEEPYSEADIVYCLLRTTKHKSGFDKTNVYESRSKEKVQGVKEFLENDLDGPWYQKKEKE